jgi:uncharacterized damage-inducible protein DinB
MSAKDQWLQTRENELSTTLRVLKAYPTDKLDYKPHEKSRSARELAWTFASEEAFLGMILKGKIEFSGSASPPPKTMPEIITAIEHAFKENNNKVKAMSDNDLNVMMDFPSGPGKMGKYRKADLLWMMIMDAVHHRGQFSVYLRIAGGKVPSIYGPTADEPWM